MSTPDTERLPVSTNGLRATQRTPGPGDPTAGPLSGPPPAPGFAGLDRRPTIWGRLTLRQVTRLALVALCLVVFGAAAGFGGSLLVTAQYAAQSDVLYAVTREQPTGFLREDRNLTTQLVLLRSRTVLGPVAAENGVDAEELATRITPSVVPESEVIRVELRDPDPARATLLLESVLARYLEVSNNDRRSVVQFYLDSELADVLNRLAEVPAGSPERAPLVDREQELRSRLDTLEIADLAGPAAQQLSPAYSDPRPVSPDRALAAGTGALVGLLLALVTVAVLARRTTRR